MKTIGYARLVMEENKLAPQLTTLQAFAVDEICEDPLYHCLGDSEILHTLIENLHPRDVLVITSLKRLGKTSKQLLEFLDLLEIMKIDFVSIEEGIDTRSATGKLYFQALKDLCHMENDLIRERTLYGLQVAREKGKVGGRPKINFRTVMKIRKMFHDENHPIQFIAHRTGVSVGSVYKYVKLSEEDTEKLFAKKL